MASIHQIGTEKISKGEKRKKKKVVFSSILKEAE